MFECSKKAPRYYEKKEKRKKFLCVVGKPMWKKLTRKINKIFRPQKPTKNAQSLFSDFWRKNARKSTPEVVIYNSSIILLIELSCIYKTNACPSCHLFFICNEFLNPTNLPKYLYLIFRLREVCTLA